MSEKQAQGMDPKGQVFKGAAAIVYAASVPIDGSYVDQSRISAACADMAAAGGLKGKRVLDVGCGFGTTTMAIARYCPARIVAIDSSEQHIELFRTIIEGELDLRAYLEGKSANEVLGDYYEPTLRAFQNMRIEYRGGLFRRLGGELTPIIGSSLEIPNGNMPPFDAVIGNNFLHWPMNQRKAEYLKQGVPESEAVQQAFRDAVMPLRRALADGGVLTLLEPKDFVRLDDDPEIDTAIEQTCHVRHPVFIALNTELNRLLHERHGIERKVPTTSPIFNRSKLELQFHECGLRLEAVKMVEATFSCSTLDWVFVRLPMWLGQVNLPFETKLALAGEVREFLRRDLSAEVLAQPIRSYFFVFVARRVG
ncbi:MAG: class I SAM-dependent methyltransferase [Patescibacteria group bacterium]